MPALAAVRVGAWHVDLGTVIDSAVESTQQ